MIISALLLSQLILERRVVTQMKNLEQWAKPSSLVTVLMIALLSVLYGHWEVFVFGQIFPLFHFSEMNEQFCYLELFHFSCSYLSVNILCQILFEALELAGKVLTPCLPSSQPAVLCDYFTDVLVQSRQSENNIEENKALHISKYSFVLLLFLSSIQFWFPVIEYPEFHWGGIYIIMFSHLTISDRSFFFFLPRSPSKPLARKLMSGMDWEVVSRNSLSDDRLETQSLPSRSPPGTPNQ